MLLPSRNVKGGSKCRERNCVVFCRSDGNSNDSGASGGFDQTSDLVGGDISHTGVATRPVDHHGAVLFNAAGASRLSPLLEFLGGALLRAGSAGTCALRRERYRGRGSRCLQSAEGHVSFRIFGREGAIGCAAVENCRRTSAFLGGIFAPCRNENFSLLFTLRSHSLSLHFPTP